MALNFPDTPLLNDIFSAGAQTWKWDGTSWILVAGSSVTGTSVITGAGAPNNTIGINGDSYINLTTTGFYGPKANNVWPATPSFYLGGAQIRYVHTQSAASTTWTVNHNLGTKPNVVVIDSAGTYLIGDVTYVSDSQLILSFSVPFSGSAYIT